MLPALLMTVFHGSYVCELSLGERRAEKPQLACRVILADFMSDLESFTTVAVLFFHLDLTWILSVKVGFCTPIGCFEGAVSPLADFRDRRSDILISPFDTLEAEFSHYKDLPHGRIPDSDTILTTARTYY